MAMKKQKAPKPVRLPPKQSGYSVVKTRVNKAPTAHPAGFAVRKTSALRTGI